jgi:hypothetical protein
VYAPSSLRQVTIVVGFTVEIESDGSNHRGIMVDSVDVREDGRTKDKGKSRVRVKQDEGQWFSS